MKLVFMGTPAFAVPTLEALISSVHEVVGVYTQPPRPAGRGKMDTPSPVQVRAEEEHLRVYSPTTLKHIDDLEKLSSLGAEAAVVVAYGLILPKSVLKLFPKGCLNLHPSALPRWRGAAPLQRTLIAGDKTTDICIMQMDEGLDTGPVLIRQSMELPEDMTSGELHNIAASKGAKLMLAALEQLEKGTAKPEPQSEEGVTYAEKINKEESFLDFSKPAKELHNLIRGLSPVPCARFEHGGEIIKVYSSKYSPISAKGVTPGTILNIDDNRIHIATGTGALTLKELQRPGKKRMSAGEFLKGYPLQVGTVLGGS